MTKAAAKPKKKPKQPHEALVGEADRKGVKLHRHHAVNQATRLELASLGGMTWRGEGGDGNLKVDIAHRMAVTWNVCEGIPTEALLNGAIRDVFKAVLAGDLEAAQKAAAVCDSGIDFTNDRLHDCKACLSKSGTEEDDDDEAVGEGT